NHKLKFKWVKGHADNFYNTRCDELATEAADGKHLLIDEGYEAEKS
ncbi:MAG: RNase H family protein, partial [Ginsengibacter sp.]